MNISFYIRSKKNPVNLHVRFLNGRNCDLKVSTGIYINPAHWDNKNQKIKNVIDAPNRDAVNKSLSLLKIQLVDKYTLDFLAGEMIDTTWLRQSIKKLFNRPVEAEKRVLTHTIYFTEFMQWWMDNKAKNWLTGNDAYMNSREKMKYDSFIRLVEKFEGKDRLKFKDLDNTVLSSFSKFLENNNYSTQTIKRHISRFKFFLLRAEEENIETNKKYKQRVYVPTDIEFITEPYLNPVEIETIYNTDFSDNKSLDNVRDNLIIAVWTGLRVSDFLGKLDISNFIDDFIEITTQKTKTPVVIPLHPMVKKVLLKRNGKLPHKITDVKFNERVKEVCQKAKINEMMKGKLHDKKEKRKIVGLYPKYKLVSSHIGRRSFATNHFGKISNGIIMSVCGWSKEDMMLKYIKKTNRENAVQLQQYWENNY